MNEFEAIEAGRTRKLLLGMSGGVASSVAGALLKNQGYEVLGVFLDIGSERAEDRAFAQSNSRCAATSYENASAICKRLDIPLSRVDVQGLFEDRVLDRFVHERLKGGQGSACLRCHSDVKLGALLERADELGIEMVATGHYAQIILDVTSGAIRLHKATDSTVDQSRYLFNLDQARLKRLIMPLGGIPYSMVAKLAAEFQLDTTAAAKTPDGECLRGALNLEEFFDRRVAPSLRPSGTIKTADGQSAGEHDGLFSYEIGQMPSGALMVSDPEKYVVVSIDGDDNTVTIGEPELLLHKRFSAMDVNWLHPMDRLHDIKCVAQIGGTDGGTECRISQFENSVVHVELDQPRAEIAIGRVVAFYSGTQLLGGALIDRILDSEPGASGTPGR